MTGHKVGVGSMVASQVTEGGSGGGDQGFLPDAGHPNTLSAYIPRIHLTGRGVERQSWVMPLMSILEYHVLLALAGGPLYGYAIKEAVARESAGTVAPRAGSLYRVIARLTTTGLVVEADPVEEPPPHPGHARRYYTLTPAGRRELSAEAARLKRTAAMAQKRLGVAQGRT